jgi:hypothetical protein
VLIRLAVLIAAEIAAVLFLGIQVAASPGPASMAPGKDQTASAKEGPQDKPADVATNAPTEGLTKAPEAAQRTEIVAKWNAEDPIGILLCGSVRWSDGRAVAEPSLSCKLGERWASASTAKDGTFAMPGLQPGDCKLTVRADGAADATFELTLTDDAVQLHDITLDPSFPVRVKIETPDGKDGTNALRMTLRAGIGFHVVGQRDRFPDHLAPTDYGVVFVGDAKWDGEMNPKNGFAGTLSFAQAPPSHIALLLRNAVLDQQVIQPGQQEVKFVVDMDAVKKLLGSATLRVVDADTGEPITDARVSLSSSNGGGPGSKLDETGRAVVENLAPGLLHCQINAKNHEQYDSAVRIEAGQHLDLGEIRLGPATPLTGMVLDEGGKPANATITWTELKWRTMPTKFVSNRIARVEADGTFSLWGTGRGPIAVQARSPEGLLAVGVFDNPSAVGVELRLGTPGECTVTRPDDLTRSFTLTFYDARKRPVAANTYEPRQRTSTVKLPAGDYTFDVHDDQDRLLQSGAITFGPTPTTLEIR